ncbi:MAG: hypothetical protein OXJ55_04890 [Caldilineaceae bacterium]|nr:hypothetical protein [Caldilineaceae bacterium]
MTSSARGRSLDGLDDEAFSYMERSVDELAKLIPAPRLVTRAGQQVFRYLEQTPSQALVQKLARLVSALRATRVLLNCGFVQEVGVLKRVLDETQQDIAFIFSCLRDPTDLDREFLEAFYEEEFDADDALASTQKRKMIPRRRIRDRVARFFSEAPGSPLDRSIVAELERTIDKVKSGYVHGASGHLMEMYGGHLGRFQFHMNGMQGTSLQRVSGEEFWRYVYRAILVFAMVTYRFRGDEGAAKIRAYADWFERYKPGGD